MYFTPTTTGMDYLNKLWGVIRSPNSYCIMVQDRLWICDNDSFNANFKWSKLISYLKKMNKYRSQCLFVVTPDTVCNAIETIDKYRHYAWRIKSHGWRVAFVAQDGQESFDFPPEYDALFIGGSTEWKLSDAADYCIRKAKKNKKWVHVGRVNSQKRIRHFQLIGVDSVDGTCPAFGPDINYKKLNKQLIQNPLFTL